MAQFSQHLTDAQCPTGPRLSEARRPAGR